MRTGAGSTLEDAVADTVGAEVLELEDVFASDLLYDAFLTHRNLRRVPGIAVMPAGRLPWSLIGKTTASRALTSVYLADNGGRKRAAYCSGLFDELLVGVRAPTLRGGDERPEGEAVVQLEDDGRDGEVAGAQVIGP